MAYQLQYSRYGEVAILVEWPEQISACILRDRLNFENAVTGFYVKQKVELASSYNSLLIIYDSTIDEFNSRVLDLKQLYVTRGDAQVNCVTTWGVPVCYDSVYGTDIDAFSVAKNRPKSEIIKLHCSAIYTIYFTGFLPGFLYLGGLDDSLFLDRKNKPNLSVKKGAVGIGGNQTGIYPNDSPGGWHIIGNSPVDFFNVNAHPPSRFKSGDQLKFIPIDVSTYLKIEQQVKACNYHLNSFVTHG